MPCWWSFSKWTEIKFLIKHLLIDCCFAQSTIKVSEEMSPHKVHLDGQFFSTNKCRQFYFHIMITLFPCLTIFCYLCYFTFITQRFTWHCVQISPAHWVQNNNIWESSNYSAVNHMTFLTLSTEVLDNLWLIIGMKSMIIWEEYLNHLNTSWMLLCIK